MEKQVLDYVLIPLGLLFMISYHLWLLHRILKHPSHTVIGINSINRQFWVRAMMEDPSKNGVLAVQTLRNNIMASTLLASTAIMLSSLIAVLMTGGSKGGGSISTHIYGDRTELCSSIKFFSILVCFMLAFLFNVQSIRYYSHASILINVPYKKLDSSRHCVTAAYVGRTVNRGSYFWSLGLRLLFMVAYHLWLLQRILKHPTHTVIGINSINRRLWVLARMEESWNNGVLAVQTLRNNIMASTLLASTAIMLSSLIAVLMTGGSSDVQYYSHASILINVPYKKLYSSRHCATAEYVGKTVNRGSYFWSLGLRAFYFSFPLFLWIFGPIPMFLCCIFLVVMLYFLDVSYDYGWVAPSDENTQQNA